jgi:hypothetical protein
MGGAVSSFVDAEVSSADAEPARATRSNGIAAVLRVNFKFLAVNGGEILHVDAQRSRVSPAGWSTSARHLQFAEMIVPHRPEAYHRRRAAQPRSSARPATGFGFLSNVASVMGYLELRRLMDVLDQ